MVQMNYVGPWHLSADTNFDTAFNAWQENRQMNIVKEFATEWGLDMLDH